MASRNITHTKNYIFITDVMLGEYHPICCRGSNNSLLMPSFLYMANATLRKDSFVVDKLAGRNLIIF